MEYRLTEELKNRYLDEIEPYCIRLSELYSYAKIKMVVNEEGVKIVMDKSKEILYIEKKLDEIKLKYFLLL